MAQPRNGSNVTSEEDSLTWRSYVTTTEQGYGNLSDDMQITAVLSEDDGANNDSTIQPVSLFLILFGGFLLICALAGVIPWFMRRRKNHVRLLTERNILRSRKNCYLHNKKIICDEMIQTDGCEAKMGCVLKTLLPEEKQKKLWPWLVARKDVELIELIGEGAFACVYKGRFLKENPPVTVAMKSLKGECGKTMIVSLVDEALVMSQFHHLNILGLIAVTVDPALQLPIIITPFMVNGDLRSYLRQWRLQGKSQEEVVEVLGVNRRIQFGLQIARGMKYLSELDYVHRDLATRNCLVSEFFTVKIGDFGLARKLSTNQEVEHFKDGRLPVRWLAPESLKKSQFSEKSDVWSFGVTLWEIAHFASVPYTNLPNKDVLKFVESGGRLELQEEFPQEICGLVDWCFAPVPEDRPTFAEIVLFLEDYMTRSSGYLILNDGVDHLSKEADIVLFSDSRIASKALALV